MLDKLNKLEDTFDKAKLAVHKRLQANAPLQIVPYLGYGTANFVYCKGRVLIDKGITTKVDDSYWRNLRNALQRLESDEIPDAILTFAYNHELFNLNTDKEGYFTLTSNLKQTLKSDKSWHTGQVTLLKAPFKFEAPMQANAQILVPPSSAKLGIISDLDDTVIKTNVTSLVKMLYQSLLKNAYTRTAFKGVNALYWAFRKGFSNGQENPIFYVSNSPWNFYDMLLQFLELNAIPKGPILLRDFGFPSANDILEYKSHKHKQIINILRTYPHLSFILIGDSGEKDTDTYIEVARAFPKRIAAIYIRSVQDEKRDARVQALADREDDVDVLVINSSLEIAQHAHKNGFISLESLTKVEQSMYTNGNALLDMWMEED